MLLYGFIFFLVIAAFLSFENWRRGIFFLIFIAAVQDPLRKMIPGAPGYLALSIMPVWFAMVFKSISFISSYMKNFTIHFSRLSGSVKLFIISLVPASLISATYGPGSWQITIIGLLSYSSLLLGILLGYVQLKDDSNGIRQILVFYCIVTAVMLIGTPLEYLGIYKGWRALGTSALGMLWIRTTDYGFWVKMFSGFYRSPDVMGWHSVTLTMFSVLLAFQSRGGQRFLWIVFSGWGLVGGMLCGRRKMLYMLPLFGFVLTWLFWRVQSNRFQFKKILVILLFAVSAGYGLYQMVGPTSDVETYYFNDVTNDSFERFKQHGFLALVETYRQSGFFGEGLGTATQGVQHLQVARPRTWQEGGLSRVLVELGVPGFLCFILFGLALIKSLWVLITRKLDKNSKGFVLLGGLFAVMCGNSVAFVVSGQIYGDPFIIIFVSFISGLILSGARMVNENESGYDLNPVKNSGSLEIPISR